MTGQESVTEWIQGIKAGDESAARRLWARYFNRLAALAKQRLDEAPTQIADEEDVALSVLKTLCRGAANGHFSQLTDRHDLWCLLLAITKHKTADHIRREGRKKRGEGRVRNESAAEDDGLPGFGFRLSELMDESPGPEVIVAMDEEFRRLLASLRDDNLRRVAILMMEGHTQQEIAEQLGCSVRTIRRKLELIRGKWRSEGLHDD